MPEQLLFVGRDAQLLLNSLLCFRTVNSLTMRFTAVVFPLVAAVSTVLAAPLDFSKSNATMMGPVTVARMNATASDMAKLMSTYDPDASLPLTILYQQAVNGELLDVDLYVPTLLADLAAAVITPEAEASANPDNAEAILENADFTDFLVGEAIIILESAGSLNCTTPSGSPSVDTQVLDIAIGIFKTKQTLGQGVMMNPEVIESFQQLVMDMGTFVGLVIELCTIGTSFPNVLPGETK